MSAKDFIILSELGKGSYSSVYKVKRISDGKQYALKKVRLPSLKQKQRSNALNQVRILASINSQYIVSYKQAFIEDSTNSLCIIMEFADEGDLQQKINKTIKKRAHFSQAEVWKIIKDTLNGLKVLHQMKIVHRDIKTANIFISGGLYKLGDLNVSKILERGLAYTQTGTPYYASPQVWRDEPYNNKSDIWSLGCVIYEVCSLRPPFQAKDMQGLFKKVQTGQFDRIPSRYSQDLQKFIQLCLQMNTLKRPTCEQLLKSPLIHGIVKQYTSEQNNLLDTIKIPRNLNYLKDMLPKSKYQQTQTTTQRVPSRRSDLTNLNKQERMIINIRKNGSEKSMLPQVSMRNQPYIKIDKESYLNHHIKRNQGSYQLSADRKPAQPRYTDIVKQRLSALNKLQKMNEELQVKLIAKQRNLLGKLPTRNYSNSERYNQSLKNPVKLPPIQIQRPGISSLRANNNNNRPNYQYSRPSWWG